MPSNVRSAKDWSLCPVQHHHAHAASCMVEHGLQGPAIGVTLDGTGFGTDGAIWGGEFLVSDYRQFHRAAHLRYVAMPGGEQAIREPWRMALAHLLDAGCDLRLLSARLPAAALQTLRVMLARRLNTPLTSSMGRLFDAVAALAGVRDRVSYEGQAAMELEWLATGAEPDGSYPFALEGPQERETTCDVPNGKPPAAKVVIDTRPLVRAVAEDANRQIDARRIARRFHSTLVELIAGVCGRIRQQTAITAVVLSGGVFMNALLTCETVARLAGEGFEVYRHRLVPPNDGGLSLGQLAIAAARIASAE